VTDLRLLPLLAPGPSRCGALARPAVVWDAATPCVAADEWFRAGPERASLLVTDGERPSAVGLVSRSGFLHRMTGRFGFGAALFGRAALADVALWDPVVVSADTPVQDAAAAVLQRGGDAHYDDLVVRYEDDSWGTLSALSVLEALSRILAERALFDPLTGLANRELLLAELRQRLDFEPTAGTAVLFIDLDRFKQVNDVHGHHTGDMLLKAVAGRLRRVGARPGDLVARLGGDEFAVMLALPAGPQFDPAQRATAVATRLLAAIAEPIRARGVNLIVAASIGVAISGPSGSDPDTLLREADVAMYQAKRAGGDRIHTVQSVGTQLAPPLIGLAIDDTLSRALHRGEFVVHYQPIMELRTGRVVSMEALIRWQHPQHGLLPPGDFLPAAEVSGLIVSIDCWVLAEACRQLVRWDRDPTRVAPAYVNVNVSRAHLAHPALLAHVREALHDSGLAPARLRLELPETATLEDLRAAGPALKALREEGVRLTLDDLGAGSSTLRHLSDLPVDGVKIDRSFVNGLLINERDAAVVRLLIDLAHNIKVWVTAEGIESAEQQQLLVAFGCTYGQGYYLGRPAAEPPLAVVPPAQATSPA